MRFRGGNQLRFGGKTFFHAEATKIVDASRPILC